MCLCGTQRTIHVTVIEAVSPIQLPPSLWPPFAAAQVAAGLWHLISMACQLKANVPTCPPLCVGPASKSSQDYLIFSCLCQRPPAICIWEVEQGVSLWTIAVACEQASERSLFVTERRGKRREQIKRAAQSICQLIDEEQRRGEWEERWRRREKRWLKDLVAFCQATTTALPPSCFL